MADDPQVELGPAFERTFAEPLEKVLDLDTWYGGSELDRVYGRLQEELEAHVNEGLAAEDAVATALRREFFDALGSWSGRPPLAGRWKVSLEDLERVHRRVLFSGEVEACDGVLQVHDSLALTVLQFGVGLIGYRGDEGSWGVRLFRRDLTGGPADSYAEAMALVEARQPLGGHDPYAGEGEGPGPDDATGTDGGDRHGAVVSELGGRGLRTFAQRAVLARRSTAPWRMGRGSPAPFELLTGSGAMRLVEASVAVLRELLLEHRRFVFVPAATRNRGLLTVGNALQPLEFAVLRSLRAEIAPVVERGNLRGEQRRAAQAFVEDAGREVVVGVFRASRWAPPRLFYAPADPELCAQAATIAMADAVLQEHRGYPLLLDLARQFCVSAFGRQDFEGPIRAAYARHDRGIAYLADD